MQGGLDYGGVIKMVLGFSLDSMRKYHRFVEDYFKEHENELAKKMQELEEDIHLNRNLYDEESIADSYDALTDDFVDIDRQFRLNFRASILIQLYSFLEAELRMACNTYKERFRLPNSFEEERGNGEFEKAKIYLKNNVGIDITKLENYQFVFSIKKVRDCIVHKKSHVRTYDSKFATIKQFHKGNFEFLPLAEGADLYGIKLDRREFIETSISKVEVFLIDLINAVPNR